MASQNKKIIITIDVNERGSKEVDKAKKSVDKLAAAQKKLAEISTDEALEIAKVNEQIKIQNELNTKLAKSALGLGQTINGNTGSLKKNRAQSGLNNAILIETGRVASDAAYGIQGVANNIGRLLELGQEFARTSSRGMGGALKELGKSLLGVGGVIVGVQLLLSFLPKISKAFIEWAGNITVVNKALTQATEVYGKQIGRLETYVKMLNDANVSDEQKAIVLRKVNKEHEGLNAKLDENNMLTDDSINKTNILIGVLMKKAQAQAVLNEIEAKYTEQFKLQNSSLVESTGFYEVFKTILASATDGLSGVNTLVSSSFKARQDELKQVGIDIDLLQKKLKEIGVFEDDKATGQKRIRGFKQGLLDLAQLEEQYRQQSELTFILSEEKKIVKEQEFALRNLDIRVQQFKERQALRLEEYLDDEKDEKLRANARAEYNESINKAEKEAADVRVQIYAATDTKLLQLEAKQGDDRVKFNEKKNQLEVDNLKFSLDANQMYHNEKMFLIQEDIDFEKLRLSTALLSIDQRAEAELNLARLESELNKQKLQRNIDFINENKRIDMEYVQFVEQTGQLLANLAGKNEAWQKAALLVEKGAAIASVIIKTQAANLTTRVQSASAAPPPLNAPFIALGEAQVQRNNISAGLSIANILATTISSFRNPSNSGGGGGSSNVEAPDFNVVGASPESQLAQSVSAQQMKPIKAFVVGKEITNQQEFDRNIITTSALGN